MPWLWQRLRLRIIVRCNSQSQCAAGGKAAGADIPAAVDSDHSAVAFIDHFVGFGDTMLHAERIKREPHVAAGLPAELAHDRQVALVRADHHTAAKEIEDGAL